MRSAHSVSHTLFFFLLLAHLSYAFHSYLNWQIFLFYWFHYVDAWSWLRLEPNHNVCHELCTFDEIEISQEMQASFFGWFYELTTQSTHRINMFLVMEILQYCFCFWEIDILYLHLYRYQISYLIIIRNYCFERRIVHCRNCILKYCGERWNVKMAFLITLRMLESLE